MSRFSNHMKSTILAITLAAVSAASLRADPMGTAFTYQGKLNDGGSPANGSYDFKLKLYDAATGGTVLNPPDGQSLSGVGVSNGLFTVQILGGTVFEGSKRWLEIWANTNGSGVVKLDPRQELTPTPYALFAGSAGSAAVASSVTPGAINSTGIADGSITPADLSGALLTNTFWRLDGNAGTTPGPNFLGTTDNKALELQVNHQRALRLIPDPVCPNLVGGASDNSIALGVHGSVISGGSSNLVQGHFSGVGAGQKNTINASFDFVGGGTQNIISTNGPFSGILSGNANSVDAALASVVGGSNNHLNLQADYAFLGGGQLNTVGIQASAAVLNGGDNNSIGAQANGAVVGGGHLNQAKAPYSTIGGGQLNKNEGTNSTIGGGIENYISGQNAGIAGGRDNTASGTESAISGGSNNHATGVVSAVGGGQNNSATGFEAIVGGGSYNLASGQDATVSGGTSSSATNGYSTVGGGGYNHAYGLSSTVAGGYSNVAQGQDSTVGGGSYHTVLSDYSVIAGGTENYIGTNIIDLAEFGFQTNTAYVASIAGGEWNRNIGVYSAIGGGLYNTILGPLNNVEANYAVIAGGQNNTVNAVNAGTVGGGFDNAATGDYSVVPGGRSAVASHYGQFAFASGHMDREGDAQASTYVLRRKLSGDDYLYLDGDTGAVAIAVPIGAVWTLHFQISGVSVTGTNFGSYEVSGVIANIGGIHTFRLMDGSGAVVTTARPIYETPGAVGWQASPSMDGGGNLRVEVFAGETVKWSARIDIAEANR